jgi:acyl dehydratase
MTMARSLALSRDIVDVTVGPIAHDIDTRWLMAYAAALGETDARYYNTLEPGGPAAHPLFPVCYEWPAMLALRDRATQEEIAIRSVHASHDLTLHRPPRAGDTLHTTARVTGLAHRRAGTLMTVRQETVDAEGRPVSTTDYGSVYRDVGFEGEDSGFRPEARGGPEMPAGAVELSVAVPAGLAHVYTECARIWNPIHTDVAVARAAGLPDIILHGTATLALALSRVLGHLAADPSAVRRLSARFTGMVPLPSHLTVRVAEGPEGTGVVFDARGQDGALVLDGGALRLAKTVGEASI